MHETSRSAPAVDIAIDPLRFARWFAIVAGVLVVLGAWTILLRFGLGYEDGRGLIQKFDLDRELSVPTWFSSVLLLLAAALLACVVVAERAGRAPFVRHWMALAVIFTLLSLDETASIHSLPGRHIRAAYDVPAFLFYAWVIPGTAFVAVFALAYVRFLRHLPSRTARLFVTAGGLFVLGALGGEMVQGAYGTISGQDNAVFAGVALVEESLELGGTVLFVCAVADYLRRHHGEMRIAIGK